MRDGFHIGESANIEDLPEEEARALFGNEIYELWLKHRDDPPATCTVVSIGEAVLTFDTKA